MKKIIFVCHGNICRSVAAEYIMKSLTNNFVIVSRATSYEEIGNDIYQPMKRVLLIHNISFDRHYATRITTKEFEEADYIFYMDSNNLYYLRRMFGDSPKFHLISEYDDGFEVEDPWYTGRFELVFSLIKRYVETIYKKVANE